MSINKKRFVAIREKEEDFCIVLARNKTDAHHKAFREFRKGFKLQRLHEDEGHALKEQGYTEHDLSPLEFSYNNWNEEELPSSGTGGGARHTETGSGNKS